MDEDRYESSVATNLRVYATSRHWRDALVLGRPWRLNELMLVVEESRCSLLWPRREREGELKTRRLKRWGSHLWTYWKYLTW